MRTIKHYLACCALVSCAAAVPLESAAQYDHGKENTLRIATYNIYNGKTVDAKSYNYDKQAGIIESINPDIIAIEEVDSASARSNNRYALGQYAGYLGMRAFYSPTIGLEGGKYGMGLLAKNKPLAVKRIKLPGREEVRTAVIAEYPNYVFCGTHFSLNDDDRISSIRILCAEAEKYNKPFFLAGDLNTDLKQPSGKLLQQEFKILNDVKKNTWPANKPKTTIDYVAVYKKHADMVALLRSNVVNEPSASDHLPVYADVRIKLPADKLFYSEPYLQDFTYDGITVMFQTNAVVHTWIEYGTDTTDLKTARTLLSGQEPCFDIENKIRLNELKPGVKYYYRVCAQEILKNEAYHKILGNKVSTPFYSFTLPSPDTEKFTMVVLNDLHEQDKVMNKLFNVVKSKGIDYDFSVFNGDCVPEPRDRAHAIRRVNALTAAANAAEKPTIIIRGNHEIRNSYSAGMLSLTQNLGGKTYGAFSWGDTRFVILDCGEDKKDSTPVYYGLNDFSQLRQDQAIFLAKELKEKEFKRAERRILIQHIPIWGDSNVYTDGYHPWTRLWNPALQDADFDMDITAHAHRYYVLEKNVKGNPCPVIAGGGPEERGATIMVLQKDGKELRMRVFNTKGETLLDRQF